MGHPAIAEAAVIAVPHEKWGERPAALVTLRPGATTSAADLRTYLTPLVARWWLPEHFIAVASIPRTSTGKFKKLELQSPVGRRDTRRHAHCERPATRLGYARIVTDSTPPQPHQAPDALSPRSWIHLVAPRDSAHARLPDGRVYDAPPGTPLGDILDVARRDGTSATAEAPAVAAIVDGRLRELHTPLVRDADVTPVTLADSDGARIYRRSLAFLLVTAASETFPEADVIVEHSAPTVGGYFCAVSGRDPFSAEELRTLERRMREIVERDEPIVKSVVPVTQAVQLFQDRERPTRRG